MARTLIYCMALLLVAASASAEEPKPGGDKVLSGMSIVGNDDAPKSLVIVPWKSAGLGDTLDVGTSLGDGRAPVDREVFMRELGYYEIRSTSPGAGSPGKQ